MSAEGIELEPGLGHLAKEVREAEEALLKTLEEDPGRKWSPRELQAKATNGWSAAVVSIAFWGLVSSNRLRVDEQLNVHPVAGNPA
jgi:hypothetical protein